MPGTTNATNRAIVCCWSALGCRQRSGTSRCHGYRSAVMWVSGAADRESPRRGRRRLRASRRRHHPSLRGSGRRSDTSALARSYPPCGLPRCADRYTYAHARRAMVTGMTCCGYCEREATSMIVSNAEHVCLAHAIEFWTGLLGYARDHRSCCVKLEQVCTCPSCEDERLAKVLPRRPRGYRPRRYGCRRVATRRRRAFSDSPYLANGFQCSVLYRLPRR
jgi:hypothetical protein